MAVLSTSIQTDMSATDPLGLGIYQSNSFDIIGGTFKLSNGSLNYLEFSGTPFPPVVQAIVKVVDGTTW
jgi:hypothetical protein